MATSITILFSDEVLRALRKGAPIKFELISSGGARRGAAAALARRGRKGAGPREGSLGSKLVAWAKSRAKSFGVPDVMKALAIRRSHANMLLTRATRAKSLQREGRGVYRTN